VADVSVFSFHGRVTRSQSMPESAKPAGLPSFKILIVEDEYFIAQDLAEAFTDIGSEVLGPVPSIDQAMEVIRDQVVHAAVLDINIQDQMVFPVADILTRRDIPFVFASGYDEKTVPQSYQGVPRWEKPFAAGDIAEFLSDLLRERRSG
jgi:DNA-binding NtrC family response regulator